LKLRAEPYTLELRHDIKVSEQELRCNLNLDWCDVVLFNVVDFKKEQVLNELKDLRNMIEQVNK